MCSDGKSTQGNVYYFTDTAQSLSAKVLVNQRYWNDTQMLPNCDFNIFNWKENGLGFQLELEVRYFVYK